MRRLHTSLVEEREAKKIEETRAEREWEMKEKELESEANKQAKELVKTAGKTEDTLRTILKRIEQRRREKVLL